MMLPKRECTGLPGGKCVYERKKGEWVLEIYIVSILLYWPNKLGV